MIPKLPQIKKDVKDFICNEDGEIAKKSILRLGAIAMAVAIGSILAKEVSAYSNRNKYSRWLPDGCCTGPTNPCVKSVITQLDYNPGSDIATAKATHCAAWHSSHSNHHSGVW